MGGWALCPLVKLFMLVHQSPPARNVVDAFAKYILFFNILEKVRADTKREADESPVNNALALPLELVICG